MEMDKIREELARLSGLVAGWSDPLSVSALERDLVLEKLRLLYEAVRFPRAEEAAVPAVGAVAFGKEHSGRESVVAADRAVPAVAAEPEGERPERSEQPAGAVADDIAPQPAPAVEVGPASQSEACGEFRPEPVGEPAEPVARMSDAAESSSSLQESCAAADAPAESESDEDPAGLEELAARRRERRRILLSLYEADDAAECRCADAGPAECDLPKREVAEPIPAAAAAAAVPEELPASSGCGAERSVVARPEAAPQPDVYMQLEVHSQCAALSDAAEPAEPSESFLPAAAPQPEASSPVSAEAAPHSFAGESRERTAVLGEVIGGGPVLGETLPAAASVASEIVRREPI
ncbi:MAG: hypothetical protein K2O55_02255, partial [Alistipes sp.]|nr:hypothetical protein [Alistipes sp.]